jgi:response regulator NasT
MQKLRIAVADDELDVREFFQEALARMGHEVVAVATTGRELVERCRASRPDIVITDVKMPDIDGLDAAKEIYRDRPIPILIVSAHHDPEFIARAAQHHILAYLVKPIRENQLGPAIEIAMQRFEEFRAMQQEADDLRQALEDRKIIERAKGLLMKQAGIEEEEAFRRLQKLASRKRKRLVEVARGILDAAELLEPDKGSES